MEASSGSGTGGSRKIVEVFIETDSESEAYSSSEEGEATESTLTAPEVEEQGSDREPDTAADLPQSHGVETADVELCSPVSVIQTENSSFPELDASLGQDGGFDVYEPDMDPDSPPSHEQMDIETASTAHTLATSETHSIDNENKMELEASEVKLEHEMSETSQTGSADQCVSRKDVTAGDEEVKNEPAVSVSRGLSQPPSSDDPNKLYCLCQEPATFSMIQCHQCLNWFHGQCVGFTRQKAAMIKHFYCPLCIDKDPSYVTVFFESKMERETALRRESEGEKNIYRHVVPKSVAGRKKSAKKHSRRCGECEACMTYTDCRKCRFCKDMPKYGGTGRLRQKCIRRQCLKLSRILYSEDPLQSKTAVLQQEMVAELKKAGSKLTVFSETITADSALQDGVLATSSQSEVKVETDKAEMGLKGVSSVKVESSLPQQQKKPASLPPAKRKPPAGPKGKAGGRRGGRPGRKKAQNKEAGGGGGAKSVTRLSISDFDGYALTSSGRRTRRPFGGLMGGLFRDDLVHTEQQCLGPGCMFSARPHSKYCSEECGVQLALNRIRKFLPEKKKLVGTEEAMATRLNKTKLEELEIDQKKIKSRLEELDTHSQAIDTHVTRLTKITATEEDENNESESDDLTIHCVTCSQPITLRKAMVHLERCFSKLEGMVSFGSVVKNEGTNIFCDKYDSGQKTYCKRLRVLCPEHTKEPKIKPTDVCGCPLDPDFPSKVQKCDHFCRQPKKSCVQHYCWEKLRRAEIDQEKLNLYLKLEEVSEQSRLHQWQINCRSSLLAIMLHHTVNHEAPKKISEREEPEEEDLDVEGDDGLETTRGIVNETGDELMEVRDSEMKVDQ